MKHTSFGDKIELELLLAFFPILLSILVLQCLDLLSQSPFVDPSDEDRRHTAGDDYENGEDEGEDENP